MKKLLLIYLLNYAIGQIDYELNKLVIFEDKYLIKFSEELVDGDVYTTYTGHKVLNGTIIQGIKDGRWIEWYEINSCQCSVLYYLANEARRPFPGSLGAGH